MRDVPDDQPTQPGGGDRDKTTVNRQQDTPPGGTAVPPPPPPPGYDEPPTEVGHDVYEDDTQTGDTVADETQVGRTVSDETRAGQTTTADVVDPDDPRSDQERRIEKSKETSAAAVMREPAPPSGDTDDEYRWHTDRTARSESAEKDAVEFIDVKKSFGRNTILNGLNLGIPDDQISMILGPSGTGKSVCIKHMVGLLYPDEGDVLVHGESVPNMADDELFEMRKKFGVLFQDGALFGSMNLWDNVAFPLRQHTDKGEEEIADIVNRRLKEVGLGGAGDKMPNELSGGMRKRAGFARALVLDPRIVLFDEPDSGLDPVRTALLCELIQEIHEENGGAYVVITHDIMSARRVAEYIAILWKGRIVESGPAEELFNSDNQFVRQFLSGEARGPLGME
ncbi:MAG: phospholipid/cholesterol/gamma-HCH transport system ATP-binding protein [Thermoleophilaceae bacterium]|jgi:phospholipid/cholesterol/gamma-HCH transport system ATP-binding protein|nr:phospholipid/cholesterol/gamma-HCH transport system ATP-binding protein [Thermoleophilaceae bacterium]